jgi:hypothetical protein
MIKLGAYVLLGMEKMAEREFKKLDGTEQQEFVDFPISRFSSYLVTPTHK